VKIAENKVARAGERTRDLFVLVYFHITLLLSHSSSLYNLLRITQVEDFEISGPGVNVMITIFADFRQFLQKMAFFFIGRYVGITKL
jgi:hypothetical protein